MGEFVRVVTVEEEHFIQTWMALAAARDWQKRAAGEMNRVGFNLAELLYSLHRMNYSKRYLLAQRWVVPGWV